MNMVLWPEQFQLSHNRKVIPTLTRSYWQESLWKQKVAPVCLCITVQQFEQRFFEDGEKRSFLEIWWKIDQNRANLRKSFDISSNFRFRWQQKSKKTFFVTKKVNTQKVLAESVPKMQSVPETSKTQGERSIWISQNICSRWLFLEDVFPWGSLSQIRTHRCPDAIF